MAGVECYSGERGSSWRRDCVAFLDFFAKTQEARELIRENRELNLYVSRDRCLTVPKLSYLGEHSEVSQARSLHAC